MLTVLQSMAVRTLCDKDGAKLEHVQHLDTLQMWQIILWVTEWDPLYIIQQVENC